MSCCVVVACDFVVCGEVHVPIGEHFVFNLIYMDGDIKNNLFVHFEPLELSYEGSGVVRSSCSAGIYFCGEVL